MFLQTYFIWFSKQRYEAYGIVLLLCRDQGSLPEIVTYSRSGK